MSDPTLGLPESEAKAVGLSPVGMRLVVYPEEDRRFGEIAVVDGSLAKELRLCIVLAVSPKVRAAYPHLTRGVAVWLKPFFGTEVIVDGSLVLIVKATDVIGIVPTSSP